MSTLVAGKLSNSRPGHLAAGKTNSGRGWAPQPVWTALEERKTLVAIVIRTLNLPIYICSSTTQSRLQKQYTVKQNV